MKKYILLLFLFFALSGCSKDEKPSYLVTLTAEEGGSVSTTGGLLKEGTSLTITAIPDEHHIFDSWSDLIEENPRTLTVIEDITLTARFIKKQYELTLAIEGQGSVEQTLIPLLSTTYNALDQIQLSATPEVGWQFVGYTGDLTSSEPITTFEIQGPTNITAVFEKANPLYLDENGVTLKARDFAVVGDVWNFNGENYTIVDNNTLRALVLEDADLSKVVTSLVTDMSSLFKDKTEFNTSIASWDVSSVTTMESMFEGASVFNQSLEYWNTSSVTNMQKMFRKALNFNQNLNNWNTASLQEMESMFSFAASFNGNISSWDISGVTSLAYVFQNSGFNRDLTDWDIASITNLSGTFANSPFNQDISNWNTLSVTQMGATFEGASAFNQPIGTWNVESVVNMTTLFYEATSFSQDLSFWCTPNLETYTNFSTGSGLTQSQLFIPGACPINPELIILSKTGSTSNQTCVNGVCETNYTLSVQLANNSGRPITFEKVELYFGETLKDTYVDGSGVIASSEKVSLTWDYTDSDLEGGTLISRFYWSYQGTSYIVDLAN